MIGILRIILDKLDRKYNSCGSAILNCSFSTRCESHALRIRPAFFQSQLIPAASGDDASRAGSFDLCASIRRWDSELWTLDCRLSAGLRAGSGRAGAVAVPRIDQAHLELTARGLRDGAVRISAKAEYACLAVIALAQRRLENRPVPIREIAEAQRIPETFLTQILLKLKGAGLVLSTRGSAGGYRLARSPEEISLQDVLTVVDGCDLNARETQGPAAPLLAKVWEQIRAFETHVLTKTSIAQLAERSSAHDWVI